MQRALIPVLLALVACDESGDPVYCPEPAVVDCTGGVHVDQPVVLGCSLDVVCEPGTLPARGSVDLWVGETPVSFTWDESGSAP